MENKSDQQKLKMENIPEDGSEEDEEDESGPEDLSGSEEDDDEPKLRYQRLGSSVSEIMKATEACCLAVHSKFLALGTKWGAIHILDFNGNEIRRFPCHEGIVNDLSIDESGEYIGSCGEDGRVFINGLYTGESFNFSYGKPILAIALEPQFAKKNTKAFVIGGRGGGLILNQKGFFGRKDNVIHSGEGAISNIKWKGSLIAWSNENGVKIHDYDRNHRITHIEKPKGVSPQFRCHLCWENENTILIGWGDTVKIGQIRERSEMPVSGLPDRYVEINVMFQTDFSICGISPFGDYLVLLAYVEEEEDSGDEKNSKKSAPAQKKPALPELRIVTRTNADISSDSLTINGYETCKVSDYRLSHIPEESLFYVVAPKDIIVARPRDLDDHIAWLLERKKYEDAMRDAEANESQLKDHNLFDIGQKYIEHLISSSQVNKAAEIIPKILKRDAKLWEKWIYKFAEIHELRAICDAIPVGNPTLADTVYEMILGHFMSSSDQKDHEKFYNLVLEWPPTIYNIKNVTTALKRLIAMSTAENATLKEALAKLFAYDKQYDKTLAIYLTLRRGPVFELIRDYNLFDSIRDKVANLMNYDKEKALQLLVTNADRIMPEQVVEQLQNEPRLLHEYLHSLFLKDPHAGKNFHEMQVKLYAEYDYKQLLPFLRQSNYYPLAKALQICEDRNLYPEMVFLMGRMGNNKQGLLLLIEKIGDVKQAIEFIETQNDEELWDDLIDYSMKHPKFVSDLLEHIGAYVDPVKLIKKIPLGMEISGLREKVVKIISDYNLQMSLREGCKEILKADCVDLMQRLNRGQRRGHRVENDEKCAICSNMVLSNRPSSSLIVFGCKHTFHSKCLRGSANTDASKTSAPGQLATNVAVDSPVGKNPKLEEEEKFCPICMNQQAKKNKATPKARKLGANVAQSSQKMATELSSM